MSNSIKITTEWLIDKGACDEQVSKFHKEFNGSVNLTRALVKYADEFDVYWLAQKLLSEDDYLMWRNDCRINERKNDYRCVCGNNPTQEVISACIDKGKESMKKCREYNYLSMLKMLRARKEKRKVKDGTGSN